MNISGGLEEVKQSFELLLNQQLDGTDKAVVERMVALANIVMPMYTPVEWDRRVERMQAALGVNAEELALLVGARSTSVEPALALNEDAEDFDRLVPDGWFRKYLDYTSESEAPTQFHFGAMLTVIAASMGRHPLISWEAFPTFPNIYTLLIGPTGCRKSTSIRLATDLIADTLPNLNILPNEGSHQGFAKELRMRNWQGSPVSDGLIIASELTVLLGGDRYKTDIHKWFTDWYDCPEKWTRALASQESYELIKPYVCFVGASNIDWMRNMSADTVKGGYLPRHLIFEAQGRRHIKAVPKFNATLAQELKSQIGGRITKVQPFMHLSPDAEKALVTWYEGHVALQEDSTHDDLFAAWLARKLPHALKVAAVWQLADGGRPDVLEAKWFIQAKRLVDWMDPGVLRVYNALGVSVEGAVTEAVLKFIRKNGGRASQSSIIRGLRHRWRSGPIQEGIRTLQQARQIRNDSNSVEGVVWVVTNGN